MVAKTFLALSLLPSAFAHFKLNWPAARGSEEGTEDQFPCGGYNDVQQQRTDWPLSGGPLQLNMGHSQTNLAVYMAVGNNSASGFSVKLRPQFVVEVLGDFCVGQLNVPSGLNVSDGTPASIQVISNAHSEGGLYQCTDVTLRSATLSQSNYDSHCKNNTGARVTQENMSGNPNDTSSTSPSASTSGSGAASSPTTKANAASQTKAASWVLGAVGIAGLALL